MKKYILIIFVFILSISANSQIKIEYSVGYGDYKMDDMKPLLGIMEEFVKLKYPLDFATTDNFPNYVTHNIGITYTLKKHEMGANFTYLTTAGRFAYSDYSGEMIYKQILNGYRFGLLYRYHFFQVELGQKVNISFHGELSPGMTFSNFDTKAHIKVNNKLEDIDDEFKMNKHNTTGFSILPQIGANLNLPYGIGIHIAGGYDFEIGAKIKDYKVDWSGLRLNGGVSYKLPF